MLTGEIFTAQEMAQLGVVDQVVPHDTLMNEAQAFAQRIAMNAPLALGLTKRLMRQAWPSSLDDLQDYSLLVTGVMQQSDDFKESVQAFVEKREARFSGR